MLCIQSLFNDSFLFNVSIQRWEVLMIWKPTPQPSSNNHSVEATIQILFLENNFHSTNFGQGGNARHQLQSDISSYINKFNETRLRARLGSWGLILVWVGYILEDYIFGKHSGSESLYALSPNQSVTSRLETSRYRDFSQFFESIGLGLKNFGLEKKSRYQSRKYLVSKKSLGIGLENI